MSNKYSSTALYLTVGIILVLFSILQVQLAATVASFEFESAANLILTQATDAVLQTVETLASPDDERYVCPSGCAYTNIQAAVDASAPGDFIYIGAGVYTETITIDKNLALLGKGLTRTLVSGTGDDIVLTIADSTAATVSGLTISNGRLGVYNRPGGHLTLNDCVVTANTGSGGIINDFGANMVLSNCLVSDNTSEINGGGIANIGVSLTLNNSTVSSNTASLKGGGIANGITSFSLLTLNNSSVSRNLAELGGAVFNGDTGKIVLNSSTVCSNTARFDGGGIANDNVLTVTNSTLTANLADNEGGAIWNGLEGVSVLGHTTVADNAAGFAGGGLYNAGGALTLNNTIVANSTAGTDCANVWGSEITSHGHNLDSDNSCNLNAADDITRTNPLLGPLQDNDGPTLTQALELGSPAIDAGSNLGRLDSDQRGMFRVMDGNQDGIALCDIGAYEYGSAPCTSELHVCLDGCTFSSVQTAIDAANPGDVIKVATGVYTHTSARPRSQVTESALVTQSLYLDKSLSIFGGYTTTNWITPDPAANPTTLDAGGRGRVLYITGDVSPTIAGLRLLDGNADGLGGGPFDDDAGGGIYAITAMLELKHCQISSSTAELGGGIYLNRSKAVLTDNMLAYNHAYQGAGLYLNESDNVTLTHNLVVSNTAQFSGGGLCLENSDAMLAHNDITDNAAFTEMDDIWVGYGGGLDLFNSDATLNDNTISNNAAGYGGGLYVKYSNATLSDNHIISNTASSTGGGLLLLLDSGVSFARNVITGNLGSVGAGVYLERSDARFVNDVIADNQTLSSEGSALFVVNSNPRL